MTTKYDRELLIKKLENGESLTQEELDSLKFSNKSKNTTNEKTKAVTNEQLLEKAKKGETLTEEETERLKFVKEETTKNKLAVLINGVNNVWERNYTFDEVGVAFKIKVHAPTIVEQGKINALREQYLQGSGSFTPTSMFLAFQMLATIRICGEEIPEILADDDNIYATNILHRVGVDFYDWLNRFQY